MARIVSALACFALPVERGEQSIAHVAAGELVSRCAQDLPDGISLALRVVGTRRAVRLTLWATSTSTSTCTRASCRTTRLPCARFITR